MTLSRRVGIALLVSLVLAGAVAAARAQTTPSAKESTVSSKTDPNPPPPPGGAGPGVTARSWTMNPASPRSERIAQAMAQGLSRAEATDLVDGAPSLTP